MKIGIFCASSDHIAPIYYELTAELGKWLGTHNHTIIYGGTSNGLMECIAQNVKSTNGTTIGILPQAMYDAGLASSIVDELIITGNLTGRKDKIMEMSDLFIALPGGFGTLDEIFHVVAGGQVGYHNKPLLLFNQNGFYNPLIQQIKNIFTAHFTDEKHQRRIIVVDTMEACIKAILNESEKN